MSQSASHQAEESHRAASSLPIFSQAFSDSDCGMIRPVLRAVTGPVSWVAGGRRSSRAAPLFSLVSRTVEVVANFVSPPRHSWRAASLGYQVDLIESSDGIGLCWGEVSFLFRQRMEYRPGRAPLCAGSGALACRGQSAEAFVLVSSAPFRVRRAGVIARPCRVPRQTCSAVPCGRCCGEIKYAILGLAYVVRCCRFGVNMADPLRPLT